MIVKKLRLQRGWSQEQLAELAGLSTRTIQRIERGQPANLETLNALAAVFEVDIATFRPEEHPSMNKDNPTISQEEEEAFRYVQGLKGFYTHLFNYVMFIGMFAGVWFFVTGHVPLWIRWWALGWGIGLVAHGLGAFEVIRLFDTNWEKRQIEKRLGRKL